jgi:hypothetical protein
MSSNAPSNLSRVTGLVLRNLGQQLCLCVHFNSFLALPSFTLRGHQSSLERYFKNRQAIDKIPVNVTSATNANEMASRLND